MRKGRYKGDGKYVVHLQEKKCIYILQDDAVNTEVDNAHAQVVQ